MDESYVRRWLRHKPGWSTTSGMWPSCSTKLTSRRQERLGRKLKRMRCGPVKTHLVSPFRLCIDTVPFGVYSESSLRGMQDQLTLAFPVRNSTRMPIAKDLSSIGGYVHCSAVLHQCVHKW